MTDTELELAPVQQDEPKMKQLQPFDAMRAELEKLKATAETLTVTSIDDKAGMKLARATRLTLKDLRVSIDQKRKELGEDALKTKQKIDADAKELKEMIEPLETRMLLCEEFAEREAVRIEDEKRSIRVAELQPLLTGPLAVDLGKMDDADYAGLLADAKGAHAARLAAVAKAEADRIAAEIAAEEQRKLDAEERERIRQENERLKAEAKAREAAAQKEREEAAVKLKAEQHRAEAEAKAEREAARKREAQLAEAARREREIAEQKAKSERDALEAQMAEDRAKAAKQREAAEAVAKAQREAVEAKAREDRAARQKVEAELKTKREAEAKAAAEIAAAEEAKKAAPDNEKLLALCSTLRSSTNLEMSSKNGKATLTFVKSEIERVAESIEASVRGKPGQLL